MNPKLVLSDILQEAVRDAWEGRRDLFALAALPVLALAIFAGVLTLTMGPLILPDPMAEPDPGVASQAFLHLIIMVVMQLALTALFAVAWHRRYMVPGENPTVLHAVQWEPRKLRYLMRLIGVAAIAISFSIAPGAIIAALTGNQLLFFLIASAVGLTMVSRLILALPATAMDEDSRFGIIWAMGKGSTLPLMGLVIIPFAVANLATLLAVQPLIGILSGFGAGESVTGSFLANLLAGAVSFAGYAVMTTGLSIAWMKLRA